MSIETGAPRIEDPNDRYGDGRPTGEALEQLLKQQAAERDGEVNETGTSSTESGEPRPDAGTWDERLDGPTLVLPVQPEVSQGVDPNAETAVLPAIPEDRPVPLSQRAHTSSRVRGAALNPPQPLLPSRAQLMQQLAAEAAAANSTPGRHSAEAMADNPNVVSASDVIAEKASEYPTLRETAQTPGERNASVAEITQRLEDEARTPEQREIMRLQGVVGNLHQRVEGLRAEREALIAQLESIHAMLQALLNREQRHEQQPDQGGAQAFEQHFPAEQPRRRKGLLRRMYSAYMQGYRAKAAQDEAAYFDRKGRRQHAKSWKAYGKELKARGKKVKNDAQAMGWAQANRGRADKYGAKAGSAYNTELGHRQNKVERSNNAQNYAAQAQAARARAQAELNS